jgi:hypothetical protein
MHGGGIVAYVHPLGGDSGTRLVDTGDIGRHMHEERLVKTLSSAGLSLCRLPKGQDVDFESPHS